jgi:hypothetical protein
LKPSGGVALVSAPLEALVRENRLKSRRSLRYTINAHPQSIRAGEQFT